MIKAIIFDFYGVVSVRTHEVFVDEVADKLAASGEDFHDLRRQHDLGILSVEDFYQKIAAVSGLSVEECLERMHNERVLNKPLLEYLRDKLKPHYKIGMLSNAASDLRGFVTPSDALDGLFDDMIISADVGMIKPDPRIFALACERLGSRPEETLMIDDLADNCEGAKAAGLAAIQYQTWPQCRRDLEKVLNGYA